MILHLNLKIFIKSLKEMPALFIRPMKLFLSFIFFQSPEQEEHDGHKVDFQAMRVIILADFKIVFK